MFTEFELDVHARADRGEALSGETLSRSYLDLLRRYHGDAVQIDELYGIEWAYIPHFYNGFYVFKYATSIAAAALFADDIVAGKPGARERFLGLLRAGGSDDPLSARQGGRRRPGDTGAVPGHRRANEPDHGRDRGNRGAPPGSMNPDADSTVARPALGAGGAAGDARHARAVRDRHLPAGVRRHRASVGATPVQMQQTLSAYLFGFAFMNLFHGALSDSFGRRPVVLGGVGAVHARVGGLRAVAIASAR